MILIIDGNNQAFVANEAHGLTAPDGTPTQAINGFFNSLLHYMTVFKDVDKIVVAFDGGRSRMRQDAMSGGYKASRDVVREAAKIDPIREEKRRQFSIQLPIIKEMLVDLGCIVIHGPGVEADDVVAVTAQVHARAGRDAVIVSSDKDFYQLLCSNISIYKPVQVPARHITVDNFEHHYYLHPSQWLDFRAMTGDKSDNIAGVYGIGEKTAIDILKLHGSVDNFYANVEAGLCKPAGLQKKMLVEGARESFYLARHLMDLRIGHIMADMSAVRITRGLLNIENTKKRLASLGMKHAIDTITHWMALLSPDRKLAA